MIHSASVNGVNLSEVVSTRAEVRALIRSLSVEEEDIQEIEKRAMRKFNFWESMICQEQRRLAEKIRKGTVRVK